MRKLHRWLMDVPPRKGDKTVGKTIVGVTTLVFVAILISGVVIWIPRTKKALKTAFRYPVTKDGGVSVTTVTYRSVSTPRYSYSSWR